MDLDYGISAPLSGGLMLRYGPRPMIAVSGTLLILGLVVAITTTTQWQLWLGMGILLGSAPGITAMQLTSAIATRWFVERRGLVLGVLGGAVATGMLVFMPLAAWVSERWGWRAALLIPTTGALLSSLAFLWLARYRPQELGLPPLGETEMQAIPPAPRGNFVQPSFAALRLGVRHRVFWILAFAFAICGVSSFRRHAGHHGAASLMIFGAGASRDVLGTYEPAFLLAGAVRAGRGELCSAAPRTTAARVNRWQSAAPPT
ncbi:MAG: MFS transporter [Rubrivivax sp.]|nr:MFS transporter [Rubrivivax sp.]